MKILLISPSSGKWRSIGKHRFFNGKLFKFSMLSLLTAASLTPDEDEAAIIDEQLKDIPFFDSDTKDVFGTTLKVLDKIGIDAIHVSIVTPLPGTPLFKEMKKRIFDFNWEHYDFKSAVFKPENMTAGELKNGAQWVRRKFYSLSAILKRTFKWFLYPNGIKNFLYPLVCNIAYWGRLKRFGIKGFDPADNNFAINKIFKNLGQKELSDTY